MFSSRTDLLCLVLFIFTQTTDGIEIYGRCLKFRIVDTKPELDNGEWYCLNDDSNKYMYCQYHLCASTSAHCKTPESSIGKCKYCYGTCSYGGIIYYRGDSFDCLDRSNKCKCGRNNRIMSTRRHQSPALMCKEFQ